MLCTGVLKITGTGNQKNSNFFSLGLNYKVVGIQKYTFVEVQIASLNLGYNTYE